MMARKALGEASLQIVSAVRRSVSGRDASYVRIACSGGPDSLALAMAAQWVCERDRIDVRAMIVDHGLQDSSAQVAARTASQLAQRGIDAEVVRVEVNHSSGMGLEASARQARYAALGAVKEGETPDLVLLGHTLDDQAETVLLGLARGSGTRSLAGMPAEFGEHPIFLRPLLDVGRSFTKQACIEWGLSPWVDPHNDDSRFLRSRVRNDVMPMLDDILGPGVVEALARTAVLARADADLLDALAASVLADHLAEDEESEREPRLDCQWLGQQPPAMRGRIVRQWLSQRGVNELDFHATCAVLSLVDDWHGQQSIGLPEGASVRRICGRLVFVPAAGG